MPVVAGFHPDPTICRVGDDYYLAHSSFEYFPGAPIFHSVDLVTWTQIGHILDRRSQFRRGDGRASAGIYGSTLRHHGGTFWFITTNVSDHAAGQVIVRTDDPAGDWSDPVFVPEAVGIDPDLAWDVDGTCYLTWHALDFGSGEQSIRQAPIDLRTGSLLSPAYDVWQGSGMPAAEGPHLHRVDDTWYLLLAEGGTERGHCVTVARAASPRGPFEACAHNPVFTRRSSVHEVQNVGHADLVQTREGGWAAVYLGVRPHGSTPGFHVLGRETYIAGIDWVDGWPQFDVDQFQVPLVDSSFAETFQSPELDQRWVVPGGEASSLGRIDPLGLVLQPASTGPTPPLCFRVTDLRWTAEAIIEGDARFELRIDDRHYYRLEVESGRVRAVTRVGEIRHAGVPTPMGRGPVHLRIEAVSPAGPTVPMGHAGPDEIVLSATDGTGTDAVELARLDGRYLATEVASGFTGRMLGISAAGLPALVRSVTYQAHADRPHEGSRSS